MTNWRTAVISVLLSLWFNKAGFLAVPSGEPVIESGVEQPMKLEERILFSTLEWPRRRALLPDA